MLEPYGADATRYGLLKMASSQDPRFSFGSIEEGRKLAIKLWNVSRLLLQNAGGATPDARPQALEERWILARLEAGRAELEDCFDRYDFAAAVKLLYRLTFDEFCDWYAEAVKPRLYDGDGDAQATALAALERLLKLLHPVMPHVTEEIWSQFHDDRLIVAAWPEPDDSFAADAEALDRVQDLARIFRRSGVSSSSAGEERRIFEAVVQARPREGERERRGRARSPARGDRAGREDARQRAVRRERAGRRRRGRARQAGAIPPRARCPLI